MPPVSLKLPLAAVIEEEACIGCALCLEACPVDAIVGAAKRMHTVIAAECIGCGLCLPPCPVDCIAMVETGKPPTREERRQRAALARRRHAARAARLERERSGNATAGSEKDREHVKRETIERVMRRARERLKNRQD